MTMKLQCITLIQPWASWVAFGWKPIETRTHSMFAHLVGHRVGIHAGKKWDDDAIGAAEQWLTLEQQHITEELKAVRGVLLATAHVRSHLRLDARHSQRALIDCGYTRRFGLFLEDLQQLKPVPIRGAQGVWSTEINICRHCGCSDAHACDGGCAWVNIDQNVCSACAHLEPAH